MAELNINGLMVELDDEFDCLWLIPSGSSTGFMISKKQANQLLTFLQENLNN